MTTPTVAELARRLARLDAGVEADDLVVLVQYVDPDGRVVRQEQMAVTRGRPAGP